MHAKVQSLLASKGVGGGVRIMIAPADIKLVLSDVDGTLVTHDQILTAAAREAVRELRKAGIAFAITSSRPPRGLRMLIEPLAMRGPIAGCNGGYIVNPDSSLIAVHLIDPALARQVVTLMTKRELDVWIYTRDAWIVPRLSGPHVAREAFVLGFDPTIRAVLTAADLSTVVKIVGVSDNSALVAACEQEMQEVLCGLASAERSQSYLLDITHPQANKGAVVIALAKRLEIRTDQIATIGDMPNDVLMFKQSGLSIAMGNASDEVKAQASVVTESNENEGFANAMHKIILGPVLA